MRNINLINVVIPFCVLLSISGVRAAGTESDGQGTNEQSVELRKVPAGQEFSGFLKDYSNLKPNPTLDRKALTFAKTDSRKNLHKYIAVIVEPVQVYLASDADESKLPDKARGVGARYFHKALVRDACERRFDDE